MEKILELRQQVADLIEEQKNLVNTAETENRDLNEDEENRFTKIDGEIDQAEARIERLEKIAEREKKEIAANGDAKVRQRILDKEWESLGEQLVSIARASTPGGSVDPRLLAEKETRAASGLNESIPSEGGFLIKKNFIDRLAQKTHETAVLLDRCTSLPVGENSNGVSMNTIDETSRADGSRWGGIQVYRANEADKYTSSKPKFGKFELSLEKMIGLCYATDEMLEDKTMLESVIENGFSEEFGFKWDDEIIRGTGAGQCLGILNSDALVSVSKESSQEADTLVYENIINMWAQMWARSRSNAVWLINQDVEPQLFALKVVIGTGGVPVYLPPGGATADPYARLFGRPVIPVEQASTLGDKGDVILADFSQYATIEKGGLQAAASIHVRFEYGENTFRFTWRNNGQPLWASPLTPYKGANDLSPFVTLNARA